MRKLLLWGAWVVLIAAASSACKGYGKSETAAGGETQTSGAAAERSLYERLGGAPAIQTVVHDFVANVAADARINRFFAGTDIPQLERHLVDQIGEATGGPQKYSGRDMKTTHAGMGITGADFDALVEDLVKALDKHGVGEREKSQLLAALGSMRGDIVEK